MPPDSLRARALSDLTDADLEELRAHGEDSLVERKRKPPQAPKFGAAVASFANTPGGGWVLIGVDDDGSVHGYTDVSERTDLQSHLGALLRAQVDPLPPYLAAWREIDGKRIGVMKVYESADAPHVVKEWGSVYVRTPAGKEAIGDQRTLLELARGARDARSSAESRLTKSYIVVEALLPPDTPPHLWAPGGDPVNTHVTVRMAPITVPSSFIEWPISERGSDDTFEVASTFSSDPRSLVLEPRGRGLVAQNESRDTADQVHRLTIAADSLGVIGARFVTPRHVGLIQSEVLRREHIRPMINNVADLLERASIVGRVVGDLWVSLPGDLWIDGEPHPPRKQAPEKMRDLHASGELVLPADDDARADLGRKWEREIARGVGIARWED
jgi:hypothetical protein